MDQAAGHDDSSDAPVQAVSDLAVELPELLRWSGAPSSADWSRLPSTPAVVAFLGASDQVIQLLTTQHLRRAVENRLSAADPARTRRARIDSITLGVRWRVLRGPFEGRWCFYRAARRLYPGDYRQRIGFGPAWMLHVDSAAPIPDIEVSERFGCEPGEWLGFWPTHRDAQYALEDLWDRFDLCRYPAQVRRSPAGQRCAYAEMGRCDAPCDGSASLSAYASRVRAAWTFAGGQRQGWLGAARTRMAAAAAEQRYEAAAQLREMIQSAARWEAHAVGGVHAIHRLRLLLALPVTRRKAWKLFVFDRGDLSECAIVPDRVLEQRAVELLAGRLPSATSDASADAKSSVAVTEPIVRMEQTWLLAHFLGHSERARALVVPLPDAVDAEGLRRQLALERQRRDAARAARAARADPGAVAPEDSPAAPDD